MATREDVEDLFAQSLDKKRELFAREPEPMEPLAISQGHPGGYSPGRPSHRIPQRVVQRPRLGQRSLIDIRDVVAREDVEDVFARSFETEDLMSRGCR